LGVNDENPRELPTQIIEAAGGLRIYQYPNQFSRYMQLLSGLSIRSYLEIGCRFGGTFIVTTEYLNRLNVLAGLDPIESVAIDIIQSPMLLEYLINHNKKAQFLQLDSGSLEFQEFILSRRQSKPFDLVFIDGDHTYEAVIRDYESVKDMARVLVFHDIVSVACPGVVRLWREIQSSPYYEIHMFIDQYQEVLERESGNTFFGIGVAIKRAHS
jgi:cephalosporin hydroxylase